MKILFDENMPRPLKKHLPSHTVWTTPEMGWAQVENGELLDLAEGAAFDALFTTDKNIPYQQRLERRNIALTILRAANNRVATLAPLIPQIEAILLVIQPGHVYHVDRTLSNPDSIPD